MTTVLSTRACSVLTPAGNVVLEPGWVAVDGGLVVETGRGDAVPHGASDLGELVLAPGFVDLQVNGLDGVDLATARAGEVVALGRTLASRGVTSYCPAFVTAALDRYEPWIARTAVARSAAAADGMSASVLGAHLEGPFLGPALGVHDSAHVRAADAEWIGALLDAHPGAVAIVTLAPEADPDCRLTRLLVDRGVVVSLGHSRATFVQACAAAGAGARAVTHLFNGMGPLHHREPGLAGAALADDRLTPMVIGDLVHVHPAVLRVVLAAKARVALVSDTVAACGDGLHVEGGVVRRADGVIAGATATLDRAVGNVVSLGVGIERAIEMAAVVPADLLGLTDRGRIVAGARADLVALDPAAATVRTVWLGGLEVAPVASAR